MWYYLLKMMSYTILMPERPIFGDHEAGQEDELPSVDGLIKKLGGIIAEGGSITEGLPVRPPEDSLSREDPGVHNQGYPGSASQ